VAANGWFTFTTEMICVLSLLNMSPVGIIGKASETKGKW